MSHPWRSFVGGGWMLPQLRTAMRPLQWPGFLQPLRGQPDAVIETIPDMFAVSLMLSLKSSQIYSRLT